MSLYRVTFVALATLFTIGMTSMASACCDGGYGAPVAYIAVAPVAYGGCGACGAPTAAAVYAEPVAPAPIYVNTQPSLFGGPCCGLGRCGDCFAAGCGGCGAASWNGCGNCGPASWNGCGNCGAVNVGGCDPCGRSVGYAVPAPSLYIVNQGPVYSGPAITVPYATYSQEAAYAPATDYPYVPGYGYGASVYPRHYAARPYYAHPYYRARYAYRAAAYMHPRYYRPGARYYGAPRWHRYP